MNDPAHASLAGQLLAQYRIGERIGAGGMGEVYRAEDTRLGRTVAVKVLHAGPTCPEERTRLFREARAASVLRSSNVAAIYDLGEHGDRPFIVMRVLATVAPNTVATSTLKRLEAGTVNVRTAVPPPSMNSVTRMLAVLVPVFATRR